MEKIYLDNAATTRPDQKAVEAALSYLEENFYNPSALYKEGFSVRKDLEKARKEIVSCISDSGKYDMIFTSCGSESDNQAIFSAARRGNFVTTEGEHAAVFSAAAELARRGTEVRYAKLNPDGGVNEGDLLSKVDKDTSLVSVIHVNNETGAVNDIAGLAEKVKKIAPRALFHSDGVQAFGKIPFRLSGAVDLYSVSAHKIGGVRGVGGLFRNKSKNLFPYIFGGGQENGLRSGTENTFAIMQFSAAAKKKFSSLDGDLARIRGYNRLFRSLLDEKIFQVMSSEEASPYILSISARGLRGEVLQHMADDAGVLVGTGSACSSRNRYSRVILACGADEKTADGVLRISFSAQTTEEECRCAAAVINRCAAELWERTK